jgi:protein-S-isoprenylcysteine O-methyltransferase Ste14
MRAEPARAAERSGVRYPPPLAFAIPWLVGWLLDRVNPMRILGPNGRASSWLVGIGLMVLGIALMFWAAATFQRAGTAVSPFKPSTALVRHGPYRLSRNPIYLADTAIYIGASILANTFWPLLFLPVALVLLYLTVIRREERFLSYKFGPAYEEYRRQVRRWM